MPHRASALLAVALAAATGLPTTAATSGPSVGHQPEASIRGTFPGSNGRIVFTRARKDSLVAQVATSEPDGSDLQVLTHFRHGTQQPTWSADGARIVFLGLTQHPTGELVPGDIWLMDADGSGLERLTHSPGVELQPSFSPDGSRILFELRGNLYVKHVDGGDRTRITETGEQGTYPTWSPDGSLIAYARVDDNRTWFDIFTIRPDGTGLTAVTDRTGTDVDPSWSPDGSQIVFQRGKDIAVVDADGTDLTKLTRTERRFELSPAWSPDGSRIVFSSGPSAFDLIIVRMAADGSRRTAVFPGTNHWFDWPDWQPLPA